ncbi:siderophore synthetase component [Microvirgula sp. AG722]|uniref:IucA/IucC family protein n=1 Tax=Microvirgula sp. AG722 TaxID=2183901 RepID=UPI000DC29589|nr:IucA/IucC family protein [Microvirgula sp. AG722]RAS15756.1 siderophore synthetase component [Microvirgula sp. AG722]
MRASRGNELGLLGLHDPDLWRQANVNLIEKALAELCYEGLITASQSENGSRFSVSVPTGGYCWQGRLNRWQHPVIHPGSVIHIADGSPATDAMTVLHRVLEGRVKNPATLANYLSETLNTLAADTQMLAARRGLCARDWLALPSHHLHSLLDGHPKAIPSKGRIGWSFIDNQRYAPEHAPAFRLHWLAVHHSLAEPVYAPGWTASRLLEASCNEAEHNRLSGLLPSSEYWTMPVHPWQWEAMITRQFAGPIAAGAMFPLGEAGDCYVPQPSLRTLSNIDRPARPDLKLSLSLLTTSAYRGLSARHLSHSPMQSIWLQQLLTSDPLLADCNATALKEAATAFIPHPVYHTLPGTPYQFDEMLGAVWRESAHSHLGTGERIVMASVLQQKDDSGHSLAAELIHMSGTGATRWLTFLFDRAVVPLYHLQARYGLGFIAHGQNLMLRFRDELPVGILLKDYQGDLFRTDEDWTSHPGLPVQAWDALPALPPHFLIHHLWTGLFASVFRFMAPQLEIEGVFSEYAFYRLLAKRLQIYQDSHPTLAPRFTRLGLFSHKMPLLSLNRARFSHGYGDMAQRPVHSPGPLLDNPLIFGAPSGK